VRVAILRGFGFRGRGVGGQLGQAVGGAVVVSGSVGERGVVLCWGMFRMKGTCVGMGGQPVRAVRRVGRVGGVEGAGRLTEGVWEVVSWGRSGSTGGLRWVGVAGWWL